MKTKILLFAALTGPLFLLTPGCALYTSEGQYNRGKWHFLAGSGEVARIKQDKLALEKLQAQPVMTGIMTATGVVASASTPATGKTAFAGYKGIVVNFSTYRSYSFVIRGPETKSYFLGPGQWANEEDCYLLPGEYVGTIYHGGDLIGRPHVFHVGAEVQIFQNKKVHWDLYAKW